MLSFFRKYQKFLFIFVTVMIVISFTFFGTFSTFLNQPEAPNYKVGVAYDGKPIMSREVELMGRFLRDGMEEGNPSVNFLNGSFIHHEFLSSGIAEIIAERYWDELKEDLANRIRKAKHFTPYVHPQAPFLTAKLVWERFSPEMIGLLEELKTCNEEVTPKTFSLLRKLYLAQTKVPAHMLRQILLYQQNQYNWIRPDPMLMQEDLALFGFHSVEDWFGPKFTTLISQFLINSSAYANQKGYHITKEEAKAELLLNAQQGLEAFSQGKQISLEEAKAYYYQTIQHLGMDETAALEIWMKASNFKRLFQECAGGVLLDPLSLNQFHSFARETAKIELFQLPPEMRFSNFLSLAEFQVYMDAISRDKRGEFHLHTKFLAPDVLEINFPELVQKRYLLKIASVKNSQLTQKINLKETWDWQLEEKNFATLVAEFPTLALEKATTHDGRFQALEKCDAQLRFKIDQFSRLRILDQHPEWIEEALSSAVANEETVAIKCRGPVSAFEGVEDPIHFMHLLDREDPKLSTYHPTDEIYYRIQVLKKPEGKEILTFSEAMQDGTMNRLLDQTLKASYAEVHKVHPKIFENENGHWKPFEEVKEKIADLLYSHRQDIFKDYMAKLKAEFEVKHNEAFILRDIKDRLHLEKQWLLVKEEKVLKREKVMNTILATAFSLKEGEWSPLIDNKDGDYCFFRLIERVEDKETTLEDITKAQKPLVLEAQKSLMKQIVDLFHEKKVITFITHENQ